MKQLLLLVLSSFCFIACSPTPKWVKELESMNPHRDDDDIISVYFRFDTIINEVEVSGILYPNFSSKNGWSAYENGARLIFYCPRTNIEYIWTDYDIQSECFKNIFMSKNVRDIVLSEEFQGFKNGDYYTFTYDTTQRRNAVNPLYPNAEYQFYDADFDGELELLINYFHGGPKGCSTWDIHEVVFESNSTKERWILSRILRKKLPAHDCGFFDINENTIFNSEEKTITTTQYSGINEWGTYCFKVNDDSYIYPFYKASCHLDKKTNSIISDTTHYNVPKNTTIYMRNYLNMNPAPKVELYHQ